MNINKLCESFAISKDIENIIETYIYYNLDYYKNKHKNNFKNCLIDINQNWKFVSIFKTGNICEECYMQSFVNNTSYIDINYCDLCKSLSDKIIDYKLINYDEFILSQEIKHFPKWNIICKSNKELATYIFYNNEYYYGDIKTIKGLTYEIKKGPILWTKKQLQNTILKKKYGPPTSFDENNTFYI